MAQISWLGISLLLFMGRTVFVRSIKLLFRTLPPHENFILGSDKNSSLTSASEDETKDEIAFETKDVLLSKKFCSKNDVFCFQIIKKCCSAIKVS